LRRKRFLEANLPHPEEVLLVGLESGRVMKIGGTVRREAGAWSETIHALLAQLNATGLACPRPLGLGEQGRETLSFSKRLRGRN
jgi:hypothetical protein